MTIENIDVDATIKKAQRIILEDKELSASTKSMLEVLILIITLLANRLNLNSTNSSKPPSSDPNRKKQPKPKTGKKPGGQKGHVGTTLTKVEDPDNIEEIKIDRRTIPPGRYRHVGFDKRQVFDIDITRVVTEYRAEILEDDRGNQFVAPFPEDVTKAVQYGTSVKSHSVYMSQFQMVPYQRLQDHFADQMNIPISEGSIFNFNNEAYQLLAKFENRAKMELIASDLDHVDETGINIGGDKRNWLHCVSNDSWTLYYPHKRRGTEAMDEMGILPMFKGILCHDHWKPYYTYDDCTHSLCNSHHLRELTRAWEQDGQQWAYSMKKLLETINTKVNDAGGVLNAKESQKYRLKYRAILKEAEIECPEPVRPPGKKGRLKKTKSRNLLERLRDYEQDTLLFMDDVLVPFSNNLGENDIRMTKVQQKISGCFRSMAGAKICCRIRSYLSTCRKHGVKASHALECLFNGTLPDFLL